MQRFENILCIIDEQQDSKAAVLQSLEIANDHQARITFASVLKVPRSWHLAFGSKEEFNSKLGEASEIRKTVIRSWLSEIEPDSDYEIDIYSGVGFIEIIRSVKRNHFDLVVKCAENPDWLGRIFGSDDMHLMRKCPAAVLMLKPGQQGPIRNILATVDVNEDVRDSDEERVQEHINKKVLQYSASLCVSELTRLHIGSVWEAYGEDFERYSVFSHAPEGLVDLYVDRSRQDCEDKLNQLMSDLEAIIGEDAVKFINPEPHIAKGHPSKEIPAMAEKYRIDLVVMGTVGRVGLPGLFIGNTAESILEQVRCSVLTIKPDGFETPVN